MSFINIKLIGTSRNLGNEPLLTEVQAEASKEEVDLLGYKFNNIPLYEANEWTDISGNKFTNTELRMGGLLELKVYYLLDGVANPVDYYTFITPINQQYLYLQSSNYPIGMDPLKAYRIIVNDLQYEMLDSGLFKSIKLGIGFGGKI